MFLPWRLWPTSRRILTIAIGIVLIGAIYVIVTISLQLGGQTPLLPIIAGIAGVIALGSFSTTAFSTYATWVRNRKKDTLEAWQKWAKGSSADRREISAIFGQNSGPNDEQAAAIVDGVEMVVEERTLSSADVVELRQTIVRVLNGLERLAVGVEQSLYDLDLLLEIGGTILVGTFQRLEPYVLRVRANPDASRRKITAYAGVVALVSDLESESARRKRQFYDSARVARIHRAKGGKVNP